MKIAINKCYGGFGLSEEAIRLYAKKKDWGVKEDTTHSSMKILTFIHGGIAGFACDESSQYDLERNDTILIAVIEELGSKKASGDFAELHVVEIPDGVEWEIDEYDGHEHIAEKHRTWG